MSFYSDASIVLIPSGTKTSKIYSQKPTDGTGDLTFSRASTATRTNASGLIESVASNVPRLDYSGGATCPRLLLEPQRTNLVSYSEQFENAFWLKGNSSTISANATTSPDGTLSADKHVSANSTAAFALGWVNASVVSGTVYTFSVYLKRSEVRFVQLRNNINGNLFCNFDLELGVAGTPSAGLTASISNAGSGWYRCAITATSGVTGTVGFLTNMGNAITDTVAPFYAGNGVNGYFAWGAQLEVGSFVSSYIPTTTAAVTRLADACTKTGISSLIGQQEGVVYWEGILPQESTIGPAGEVGMFNTERQANARTAIVLMHTASTGTVYARLFIGNGTFTPIVNLSIGGFVSGSFAKIAFAYKSGDSALYINGVQRATSSATYNSVTTMNDINFNDNVVYYGYTSQQSVSQALLFPTRLTNAQLAELTTL